MSDCFCKDFEALKSKILEAEKEYWTENQKRLKEQVIPSIKKRCPELKDSWINEMLYDGCGGEYSEEVLDEYGEMCENLLEEINKRYNFCEFDHQEYGVRITHYIGDIEVQYEWNEFTITDKDGNEVGFCPNCGKIVNEKVPIVWGEKPKEVSEP